MESTENNGNSFTTLTEEHALIQRALEIESRQKQLKVQQI